jgi:hypothetical protein
VKIIRWPIISLALLALLVGFFLIGYAGSPHLRSNLESFATDTFDTPVSVGDLELNIYHSHIGAESITVTDPENKARYIFTAEKLDLQADLAAFFQKRILLNYIDVVKTSVRLLQKKDGTFDFISEKAVDIADLEPTTVKVGKVITWTADKVNPVEILSKLGPSIPGDETDSPETLRKPEKDPSREKIKKPPSSHGYRLKIPKEYPDITVDDITVWYSRFSLYPYREITPMVLHGINGRCRNISSRPTRMPKPITFTVSSYIGDGTQSWTKVSGSVDVYKGRTNLAFRFEATNVNLVAWLPLMRVYSPYTEMLDIKSGILYVNGRFSLKDGVVSPSSMYIHVKNFTARATGEGLDIDWLRNLSVSDAEFDLVVPIDNKDPYIHFAEAVKEQNFRVKQMRNIELRIKTDELKKEFLD